MKRYLTIMSQIWPWYLQEIFVNRFRVHAPVKLPKTIGAFRLIKILSPKGFPFGAGLYKRPHQPAVVIKIWQGKTKDIYYFNLLHQIAIMKVLTAAQKRIPAAKRFGFSTPAFISSSQTPNQITLVMEKVEGKSLEYTRSPKNQFSIYSKCLNYLSELSENLTEVEREVMTTKSIWDFVLLYPFILTTAVVVQPRSITMLLKGVPFFLAGVPDLANLKPNTLVHGDIHPDNILVSGKNKYSLIDVENMRLCYAQYEPASTISLKGNSNKFKQLVVNKFLQPASRATRALIVNNATHNISGDKNPQGIASYKQAFNLAFKI